MTKGTTSKGKRHNKSHIVCRRCNQSSFHIQKHLCARCGYPNARIRNTTYVSRPHRPPPPRRLPGAGRGAGRALRAVWAAALRLGVSWRMLWPAAGCRRPLLAQHASASAATGNAGGLGLRSAEKPKQPLPPPLLLGKGWLLHSCLARLGSELLCLH